MRLKIDNGSPVLQDGKPVYVKDDNTEVVADVPALFARISALNGEAKSHRESKEAAEAELQTERGRTAQLGVQLQSELVGGNFARSKFISEEFAAQGPAGVEIAQALFAKNFSVVDGKLVATDAKGERIMSAQIDRIGQPADFDEALARIVDTYPHRDTLIKGRVKPGGGSGASLSGRTPSLNRSAFQSLDAKAQAAHFAAGGVVTD